MALRMQQGTLTKSARFKKTGADAHRVVQAGQRVRYARSPMDPGQFVIWADAGFVWYIKCNAIDLPTYVEAS